MSKIEELKNAYEASTSGVWEESQCDGLLYGTDEEGETYLVCDVVGDSEFAVNEQDAKNAKFIALAHNLMPDLLSAVNELQNFIDYLTVASNDDGAYEHEIQRAMSLLTKLRGELK